MQKVQYETKARSRAVVRRTLRGGGAAPDAVKEAA